MSSITTSADQPSAQTSASSFHWIALSVVLLAAALIRFWGLDSQSLWYDEGWSVHLAQLPLRQALPLIASPGHTHPPGYYVLLNLWVRLWGHGEAAPRSLSALLGVFEVLLVYLLGSKIASRRMGILAAALLALCPANIVYSQEARMYALLSCTLTAATLLMHHLATDDASVQRRRFALPLLVLAEVLAVYSHFFSFFALFSLNLWYFFSTVARQRRGHGARWRAWILSQIAVLLAFLPWVPTLLARSADHSALGASPVGLLSFGWQSWAFLLSGHIAMAGRSQLFASTAQVAAVAAVMLVGAGVWTSHRRRDNALPLALVLGPLVCTFALMSLRPGYHPRYIVAIAAPLALALAGSVDALWHKQRLLRLVALLLPLPLVAAGALALFNHVADAYYQRDDARAAAKLIEERYLTEAPILMDNDDWALRYYLSQADRTPLYIDARMLGDDALQEVLSSTDSSQVALVKWHQGTADPGGIVPFGLELAGTRLDSTRLPGYTVHHYQIDTLQAPLEHLKLTTDFGPLRLVEALIERTPTADETLTAALTWQPTSPAPFDGVLRLDLADADSHIMAQIDDHLVDANGNPLADWAVGTRVTTYHVLPLGRGLGPVEYELGIQVYHEGAPDGLDIRDIAGAPAGKRLRACSVEIAPSLGRTAAQVNRQRLGLGPVEPPLELSPGLNIAGLALPNAPQRNGERIEFLLEWQNGSDAPLDDLVPRFQLYQNGDLIAEQIGGPLDDRYPTSWWQAGETVLDWREIALPVSATSGPAELTVSIPGSNLIRLGTIDVVAIERLLDPPAPQHTVTAALGEEVELVGFDLDPALYSGRDTPLTLYWRSLAAGDRDLVVFCHVLDADRRLVAQHDGPPANGQRPTSGWIAGEYVVDAHAMVWTDPPYEGPATIQVGFYDPTTGDRLLSPQGHSQIILADGIIVRPSDD